MGVSPNFGERRDGAVPDLVVIHYTAMADWTKARDWLCNPEAEVSAHYIISPAGETVALVDEDKRAWHAGAGAWGDVTDVNSRSIGIELSNDGASPFSAPLMDSLEALLRGIITRWSIPPERVIGHSDLAPGRKIDPGPRFDWARLSRAGLAVSSSPTCVRSSDEEGPVGTDEEAFTQTLRRIGYTADAPLETLLSSFRLRHRPGHSGPLDAADIATASELAERFPVAQTVPTS